MATWLYDVVVLVVLALIVFLTVLAALHPNEKMARRAVRILRMLLKAFLGR